MSGGYRKYLLNVIPRIAAHPDVESILCASPATLNVQSWFEPLHNVKFVDNHPYRLFGSKINKKLYTRLKEYSPDVFFIPTERYFRFHDIPVVNMIQNMEPFVINGKGRRIHEQIKTWIHVIDAKRCIKASDRIIAISDFVKQFIVNKWQIDTGKIGLVYHGVEIAEEKTSCRPYNISYEWGENFLFTAGSIRPARGLEDVLKALKYFPGLVIAGETIPSMKNYEMQLKHWIQEKGLASKIIWAGSLNEHELSWCYKNCLMFVMTSRVEACPNIALEAMAHGCICVSSISPPMPEIFSDAAVYYNPEDPKSLSEAVNSVLCLDNDKRRELSEKAKKRAGDFSWDICAEKTVEELRKAVAGSRG